MSQLNHKKKQQIKDTSMKKISLQFITQYRNYKMLKNMPRNLKKKHMTKINNYNY